MDLPTARAAQENIISLFKDPGMHKKMLGQSNSRGRIMGALLATRSQENGKFKELEKIKKVAGAFVGDQKFQIYDGHEIAFECEWAEFEGIWWKTTKYEEPVFQKWMLWEFKRKNGLNSYTSCLFATYALALSLADTLIADDFYKSFAPKSKQDGFAGITNFSPENPNGSIILPIYSEIAPEDMP